MATLGFEIEAQERTFDAVPDGWYKVSVNSFDMAETKGGAKYLKADLVIIEGEFVNQHIFDSFFCYSGQYTQSNIKRVGALAKATGFEGMVKDTTDIKEGAILWVKTAQKEGKEGRVNVNVSEYKPKEFTPIAPAEKKVEKVVKAPAWAPKE